MWNWPADPLASIYLCCFVFGLIFSVVSVLTRFRVGRLHLPVGHHGAAGHGHLAHGHFGHGHAGSHAGTGEHASAHRDIADAPSPLNLSSAMVFLTWFGATGYILHVYYGALAGLSLAAAVLVGWTGAMLIYLFMARVLWRGQTELDPRNYQIAGAVGRVTSSIHAGGTGEVVYTLDGKRRVDGARSLDGTPIASGTEVAVVRYDGGLAYVCPLSAADRDAFLG
jgi:membrane protein implicated in regulation of membrane protease activity